VTEPAGSKPAGRPRCSLASLERHDPMAGTAPQTSRWLLVEDQGPWGPEARPVGSLGDDIADRLHRLADAYGARMLLFRRPGRQPVPRLRRYAWGRTVPGDCTLTWHEATTEQLQTPYGPDEAPTATGPEIVILVCAHGRHDVCCALHGRPVAKAFADAAPDRAFECTHTGGDRFAANVLVLPTGLLYGRVTVDDVHEVLGAVDEDAFVPRLLRGRTCYSSPVQAAAHAVAVRSHMHSVDAWAPMTTERVEHAWLVRMMGITGDLAVVRVRERQERLPWPLTCNGEGAALLRTFHPEVVRSRD
jgi:hypothetical protein